MGLLVPEAARVDIAEHLVGIPRTIGHYAVDMSLIAQLRREEVDGAAKVGRTHIRSCARAAIEVHIADSRGRNIRPGVVAGVVRVVEGDAVPGHGVIVVDEAAEVDLGLAVAYAVGVVADRAGGGLDDVSKVGHRRGVLRHIVAADLRARRSGVKQRLHRSKLRSDRRVGFSFNGDFLRDRSDRKLDRNGLVCACGNGNGTLDRRESRSRDFHGVGTSRYTGKIELALGA